MPVTYRHKVLITDYVWPSLDPERAILEGNGIELIVAPDGREETLRSLATEADAIMFCFAKVPASVLRAAPKCKVASRYGIGVDNIDIPVCTELGIVVTNVPDYCVDETSDHALGMVLALNRRLAQHDRAVRSGGWARVTLDQPMRRTRGSTLGIIGYGRTGKALAAKAGAFGMKVIAYSRSLKNGEVYGNAEAVTLETLLRQSDFISLHVPLTLETRGMIGRRELSMMKQGAIIVNCARGGLIDEAALADALASGHIAGAGLDVMDPAPPRPDHPLFKQESVIITPHTAFFSQASTVELETRTAREVVRVLLGQKPENVVNPQVLGKSRSGL
jgi:D-3-phosphoglycerate dehydrogenase